jgi:hypothetical protein
MVIRCANETCVTAKTDGAKFMNERYGAGLRVHTPLKDGKAKCVCCLAVRDAPKKD